MHTSYSGADETLTREDDDKCANTRLVIQVANVMIWFVSTLLHFDLTKLLKHKHNQPKWYREMICMPGCVTCPGLRTSTGAQTLKSTWKFHNFNQRKLVFSRGNIRSQSEISNCTLKLQIRRYVPIELWITNDWNRISGNWFERVKLRVQNRLWLGHPGQWGRNHWSTYMCVPSFSLSIWTYILKSLEYMCWQKSMHHRDQARMAECLAGPYKNSAALEITIRNHWSKYCFGRKPCITDTRPDWLNALLVLAKILMPLLKSQFWNHWST